MSPMPQISPTSPDFDALLALLDREQAMLSSFIAALDEEQQTLARSADIAALPGIVERKSSLYSSLNEVGTARSRWLAGHAFQGIASTFDAMPALEQRWNRIVDLARTARRTNELNGRLVRTRMGYNKAALDALRHAHGSAPAVYGADGRM